MHSLDETRALLTLLREAGVVEAALYPNGALQSVVLAPVPGEQKTEAPPPERDLVAAASGVSVRRRGP